MSPPPPSMLPVAYAPFNQALLYPTQYFSTTGMSSVANGSYVMLKSGVQSAYATTTVSGVFSAAGSCPTSNGISLLFNAAIGGVSTGTETIADSFAVGFYDSRYFTGSGAAFAVNTTSVFTQVFGAYFPQVPGITAVVDLYGNVRTAASVRLHACDANSLFAGRHWLPPLSKHRYRCDTGVCECRVRRRSVHPDELFGHERGCAAPD